MRICTIIAMVISVWILSTAFACNIYAQKRVEDYKQSLKAQLDTFRIDIDNITVDVKRYRIEHIKVSCHICHDKFDERIS